MYLVYSDRATAARTAAVLDAFVLAALSRARAPMAPTGPYGVGLDSLIHSDVVTDRWSEVTELTDGRFAVRSLTGERAARADWKDMAFAGNADLLEAADELSYEDIRDVIPVDI